MRMAQLKNQMGSRILTITEREAVSGSRRVRWSERTTQKTDEHVGIEAILLTDDVRIFSV